MEFLIKEAIEINWYYLHVELMTEVNKERKINQINPCSEEYIKTHVDFLKMGHEFLKIEGSVGSYYCQKEKKRVLRFSVKLENNDLIKTQVQGLFEFIIIELGKGKQITKENISNKATLLENYYYSSKFVEKLENKLPEKEKASEKKPKL